MIISMPSSFFVPITYSIELITDEKFKVSDEYRGKDNFNIYDIQYISFRWYTSEYKYKL